MGKAGRPFRALIAVLAAFVVLSVCGCSVAGIELSPKSVSDAKQAEVDALSPSLSTPTIKESGKLIVGVNLNAQAPFVVRSDTGVLSGMDIDLASALGTQLGLKVSFVGLTSTTGSAAADCDIVMGFGSSSSETLTLVGSYAEDATAFFHRGDATVVSASDLANAKVGLQAGSASERALNESGLVMTQNEFDNLNDAFDALESGTVDYVLCDAYSGGYLAAVYSDIHVAGTLDVPESIGIGVAMDNTQLQTSVQQALNELSSNGVLDLVRARWVGDMAQLTTESQVTGLDAVSADAATGTDAASTDGTSTDGTSTDGTSSDGTTSTDETAAAA